ncbi:tRNA isopentenyl-2-thiomethyl-A-37 hydroxylase MiaE [Pontiellaceae bacterium B12227]|nr:tRNA isopentenyl-2-thiomethyl-A-37 hydroxylase MiaE [Pontiellaceae bacterium B12227]
MELVNQADLDALFEFLPCRTPEAWIQEALNQEEMLLLNHCYLEQCAARNALQLMFRCPDKPDVLSKMSKLAREELRHFEKVHELLTKRGYIYKSHQPSRYAGLMNARIRKINPGQLIDSLIVGAYIEARSCERFASLAPHVDEEIATFFRSLLKSEARHFKDYLTLAQNHSAEPIDERIAMFGEIERNAIESEDDLFRFHSGVPLVAD